MNPITRACAWPQTLSGLLSALSTFPAGRAFLAEIARETKRADITMARVAELEAELSRLTEEPA